MRPFRRSAALPALLAVCALTTAVFVWWSLPGSFAPAKVVAVLRGEFPSDAVFSADSRRLAVRFYREAVLYDQIGRAHV